MHRELRVVASEKLGRDYTVLTFIDRDMAAQSVPGNFFQLKSNAGSGKLRLYKPISVFQASGDRFSFMIKDLGQGSLALCELRQGDTALLTGPLGNTFPIKASGNIVLISGGVGYPPLAFFKNRLPCTGNVVHIHGGACQSDVFPCDIPCTEDGSVGYQGIVTDRLSDIILSGKVDLICSCGPLPMLKAVHRIAFGNCTPHLASLEAYMACGIGVCHGCSIPYGTDGAYARVCKDGPVFDAYQVRWGEL